MSADTLRRAGALLREHAEKADDGEGWCPNLLHGAIRHVFRNVDSDSYLPNGCDEHGRECGRPSMYDGRYIAMMHPPVVLALADVLDGTAEEYDGVPSSDLADQMYAADIALARAILREDQS